MHRQTRPSLHSIPDSSSSTLLHHPPPEPIHKLYPLFAGLTFYIVPAKLSEDLGKVYECVEELGGRCIGIEDAEIVITALQGRARLVRTIGREWIVCPFPFLISYFLWIRVLRDE